MLSARTKKGYAALPTMIAAILCVHGLAAAPRQPGTLPCSEDTTWQRYDVDTSKDVAALKLFVAPNGNDTNAGTAASPLATITGARDKLRPQLASVGGDAIVYVRGGSYVVDSTYVFTQLDAGQNGHRVIYKNFPGEIPVIEAGRRITGWTKSSGNVWQVQLPDVQSGKWWFRGLYVDDKRAKRKNTETVTLDMYTTQHTNEGLAGNAGMCTNEGDWALDKASGTLYYNSGTADPSTRMIFAEKAQCALRICGAIGSQAKNIEFRGLDVMHTFFPLPANGFKSYGGGGNYQSGGINAVLVAIEVEYADSITLNYLHVAHTSGSGIGFGRGATNCQVSHCLINDIGCVGIDAGWSHNDAAYYKYPYSGCGCKLVGQGGGPCIPNFPCPWNNDARNVPGNITVSDCDFKQPGQVYESGDAIESKNVDGAHILYNRIVCAPYCGASFGGPAIHQFSFNEVGQTQLLFDPMWDGAAFYHSTGGGIPKPELRGNFFWDNPRAGCYLDERGDSCQLFENVTYQVADYGLYVDHSNFGTHAYNNTVATTTAQVCAALQSTGPRREGTTQAVAFAPVSIPGAVIAPALRSARGGAFIESMGAGNCRVELLTLDGRIVTSCVLTDKQRAVLVSDQGMRGIRIIRAQAGGTTVVRRTVVPY